VEHPLTFVVYGKSALVVAFEVVSVYDCIAYCIVDD